MSILLGLVPLGGVVQSQDAARFDSAIAFVKRTKEAGDTETAIAILRSMRRELAIERDATTRASRLVLLEDLLGQYDPLASQWTKGARKVADAYRKVSKAYRAKELTLIAEDLEDIADVLDPLRAEPRPEIVRRSFMRSLFGEGKDSYDDGSWVIEDALVESPRPTGTSQLLLGSYAMPGGTSFSFEARAPSGPGQLAFAFGVQSLEDYYVYEIELFDTSMAINFIRIVKGKVEYLLRETLTRAKSSKVEWIPVEVRTRGPWLIARQAGHYLVTRAPIEDLSGRFGFFVSGATKATEAVQFRQLTMYYDDPHADHDAASTIMDELESALVSVRASGDREFGLRSLWSLRARRGEVVAKERRAFTTKIDKELARQDPIDLRRRQANAAYARFALDMAGRYGKASMPSLAYGLLAMAAPHAPVKLEEALAKFKTELDERAEKVAAAAPKPAPKSRITIDAAALTSDPFQPWGDKAWALERDELSSPATLRSGASAGLLTKEGLEWTEVACDLRLGLLGSLVFVLGYEDRGQNGEVGMGNVRCEHADPTLTKIMSSYWNGKAWESAASMTTNAFAGDKRPEWIPFAMRAVDRDIEVRIGDIPPLAFPTGGRLAKGKVGLMLPSTSRGREPVRVRRLRFDGLR
ncbi:MAG: hypothetical protein H6832_11385 [Planctomycetes bacterium]|nr:hypothetical protein [Planctomycetota bacterium]MCB9918993.1 hypothetical protein [Planctomycetota bacterium]